MAQLFNMSKPKVDPAALEAQKRQDRAVQRDTVEASKEKGARNRILNSNRSGSSLFARTGAAGVRNTFGG